MDTTENGAPEGVTDDTTAADLVAENTDDTGAEAAAEAPEGEGEKPRRQTAQERFDELTRARREAEREAAHWRRIAQESGAPREQPKPEPVTDAEPDPSQYTNGEMDRGYIRDLARYEARQAYAHEARVNEQRTQVRTIEQTWAERQQAFAKDKPDFNERVYSPDLTLTPVMADAIKTSEDGPAVAYHLATNPDEARRIAGLNPLAQVRELGKLEAKLAKPAEPSAQPKTVSDAPSPAPQVRGSSGKFKVAGDTSDFAAFERQYSVG